MPDAVVALILLFAALGVMVDVTVGHPVPGPVATVVAPVGVVGALEGDLVGRTGDAMAHGIAVVVGAALGREGRGEGENHDEVPR